MLKASIKKRTGSRSHENSRGSIEFKIRSLQQISDELGVDLPFLLTMIRRKQLRAKRDRRGHWKVTRSAYVEFISTCKYLPVWPLPPGYLSVEQACRESGFHRETIRYQIKHGYVESILYRNRFRAITRASWGAYLKFRRAGRKHMPPPPTGYLKPIAAAKMAGVTYPTIREWIRKKGLPALAISRCRVLIKETDLTAFLKRLPTLPLFNSLPAGTISATHAAKRAGTTPRTIVASIAAETLPAIKLPNGRYAVREAALAAFMKERTSVKEEQNPPGQVSLKQAARLAGVTPPSVKRWIQACGLPAMLSTGRYLIKTEDLQAFLKCRASTQRRSHVHLPTGCITAQEAAKRVGVTRSTLRKWIARGELPSQKLAPKLIAITEIDLAALLERRAVAERAAGNLLLMVADPLHPVHADLAHRLLTAGFQLKFATSPTRVFRLARSRKPQLLVIDLEYESGGGLGLASRFRAVPASLGVSILLTGDRAPRPDELDQMLKVGVCGFLQKPMQSDQFLREVRRHVRLPTVLEVETSLRQQSSV